MYLDTQKICCNHSKIWTMWLYHRVMSPNDADGMANNVDPDQTAPLGAVWSGSALFAQAYLSENLESLRYSIYGIPCFTHTFLVWLWLQYNGPEEKTIIQFDQSFMKTKWAWTICPWSLSFPPESISSLLYSETGRESKQINYINGSEAII